MNEFDVVIETADGQRHWASVAATSWFDAHRGALALLDVDLAAPVLTFEQVGDVVYGRAPHGAYRVTVQLRAAGPVRSLPSDAARRLPPRARAPDSDVPSRASSSATSGAPGRRIAQVTPASRPAARSPQPMGLLSHDPGTPSSHPRARTAPLTPPAARAPAPGPHPLIRSSGRLVAGNPAPSRDTFHQAPTLPELKRVPGPRTATPRERSEDRIITAPARPAARPPTPDPATLTGVLTGLRRARESAHPLAFDPATGLPLPRTAASRSLTPDRIPRPGDAVESRPRPVPPALPLQHRAIRIASSPLDAAALARGLADVAWEQIPSETALVVGLPRGAPDATLDLGLQPRALGTILSASGSYAVELIGKVCRVAVPPLDLQSTQAGFQTFASPLLLMPTLGALWVSSILSVPLSEPVARHIGCWRATLVVLNSSREGGFTAGDLGALGLLVRSVQL